jgi:hypothetical protein
LGGQLRELPSLAPTVEVIRQDLHSRELSNIMPIEQGIYDRAAGMERCEKVSPRGGPTHYYWRGWQ